MREEEKQLLLKDLCGRLPYNGLMVRWNVEDFNVLGIGCGRITLVKPFMSVVSGSPLVEEVRPYLRPLSSLTNDEKLILQCLPPEDKVGRELYTELLFDFYNSRHLDYRDLIKKGLALSAPEGMYEVITDTSTESTNHCGSVFMDL